MRGTVILNRTLRFIVLPAAMLLLCEPALGQPGSKHTGKKPATALTGTNMRPERHFRESAYHPLLFQDARKSFRQLREIDFKSKQHNDRRPQMNSLGPEPTNAGIPTRPSSDPWPASRKRSL